MTEEQIEAVARAFDEAAAICERMENDPDVDDGARHGAWHLKLAISARAKLVCAALADAPARKLYEAEAANDPLIHCNRFSPWEDLSEKTKEEYRTRAALSTKPPAIPDVEAVAASLDQQVQHWIEDIAPACTDSRRETVELRAGAMQRLWERILAALIDNKDITL